MFTNALLSTMQILVAAFGFMLRVCVIKSVCVFRRVRECVYVWRLLAIRGSVTLPDLSRDTRL